MTRRIPNFPRTDALRSTRICLGITQRRLSEDTYIRCGVWVHPSTIGQYERGTRAAPAHRVRLLMETLDAIALFEAISYNRATLSALAGNG